MFFEKFKKINFKEEAKKIYTSTVDFLVIFFNESKYKLQHLYETNYNNGLYHLEHGNLWDASFRFKMMKRLYPDKLEAQCQYAVCLILQGFNKDAETLLVEILEKDPKYNQAEELLNKVKNNDTKKMVEEYKERFESVEK